MKTKNVKAPTLCEVCLRKVRALVSDKSVEGEKVCVECFKYLAKMSARLRGEK